MSLHRNGKINGFFSLFEIKGKGGTDFLVDLGAVPPSLAAHLLSSLPRAAALQAALETAETHNWRVSQPHLHMQSGIRVYFY